MNKLIKILMISFTSLFFTVNAFAADVTMRISLQLPMKSHLGQNLLKDVPRDTKILTVIDGHQLTLSWLGSVLGHKVIPLGVDRFGQTGNIKELLTEFAIDSGNISNLGFKFA